MANYGKTEVVAVARGIAQQLGINIKLRSGPPCTDGTTVWLDDTPTDSRLKFDANTGTGIHEAAHVYFKSVQHCKGFADWIIAAAGSEIMQHAPMHGVKAQDYKPFAHECVNVILDIHDETRIEQLFPNYEEFLRTSNLVAGRDIYASAPNGNYQGPEWRWWCLVGILKARLGTKKRNPWIYKGTETFFAWHMRRMADSIAWRSAPGSMVLKLCMKAKEKKPKASKRSSRQWDTIRRQSLELFTIILPFINPAQDKLPENSDGTGDGSAGGTGVGGPDPMGKERVSAQQGAEKYDIGSGAGPGGTNHDGYSHRANPSLVRRAERTIHAAVETLFETLDAMRLSRNDYTGDRLNRRFEHLFTDGKAFVTRQRDEGHELHVALLLDNSGSMGGDRLTNTMSLCKAFWTVLESIGAEVRGWTFSDFCSSITMNDLCSSINLGGGTRCADAATAATAYLARCGGRKLCMILSDGDVYDRNETIQAMRQGMGCGVEYSLVGLDLGKHSLDRWPAGMPKVSCPSRNVEAMGELLIREIGSGMM